MVRYSFPGVKSVLKDWNGQAACIVLLRFSALGWMVEAWDPRNNASLAEKDEII